MKKPKLFLIHGIFMHAFIMQYMQHKLSRYNYEVHAFSYRSRHYDLKKNAELLIEFVFKNSHPNDTCHFVGHSLGGLLIRQAYELSPEIFTGRIVTLGTPHNGSEVAKRVVKDLHEKIIGGAFDDGLDGHLSLWEGQVDLGSIAGERNIIGLGTIFDSLEKPNDGTVAVKETQLDKQNDHIIIPHSHTGMVFSSTAARQVDYFLSNGQFNHASG